MKKILIILVLIGFAASCGPRRLGCGPGRCDNNKQQQPTVNNLRNV